MFTMNVPSELASKEYLLFPSKNVFDEPFSMTGVCGYVEEKESYKITSYLLSLLGGDSRT